MQLDWFLSLLARLSHTRAHISLLYYIILSTRLPHTSCASNERLIRFSSVYHIRVRLSNCHTTYRDLEVGFESLGGLIARGTQLEVVMVEILAQVCRTLAEGQAEGRNAVAEGKCAVGKYVMMSRVQVRARILAELAKELAETLLGKKVC